MSRREMKPVTESPLPRPRIRRGLPWGKLFLLMVIGLLAAAWFAPTIALQTRLRDVLVQRALVEFPGKIEMQSASAGWLSAIRVKGVAVSDGQGQEVLSAATVTTEKNLVSLLLEPRQIGTIRIEQPKLNLVMRPDGSNLEDLIRPLLSQPSSGAAIGCAVEVVDGTITASQPGSSVLWQLQELNGGLSIPQDPAVPLTAKLKTKAISSTAASGNVAAELEWRGRTAAVPTSGLGQDLGNGTVTIHAVDFPLEILTQPLHRAGIDVQLAGLLTTDAVVTSNEQTQTAKIDQLTARHLLVASPSLLGSDQVKLMQFSAQGEITRGSGLWQARNVKLQSDVGTVTAAGTGPAVDAASFHEELTRAFRGGTWEVRGDVDIAKLAAVAPATLRLREGTHISSGQLVVGLISQPNPAGHQWNVDLQANQIAAIHAGTSLEWKRPLVAKASVRELADGIVVDQLTCDSSFLQMNGSGTLQQGQFQLTGDLKQFVQEIGRFVEFEPVQAAGKFRADIEWKNTSGSMLALSGTASATAFELMYATKRPWQESQLDIRFDSLARIENGRISQIDRGNVDVRSGADVLEVNLQQPVAVLSPEAAWPCRFRMTGNLGRWSSRLDRFIPLDGWQIDGEDLVLEGQFVRSQQRIECNVTTGSVKNLLVSGAGMTIREPTLQVESVVAYDVARGELTSPSTTIAGSTIAMRADQSRWVWNADGIALDGDIHYRTNLDRLSQWAVVEQQPASFRLQGEATGAVRLAYGQGATQVDATASITEFKYASPVSPSDGLTATAGQPAGWREMWSEPRLEIAVRGSLDANGKQAILEKVEVAGDSISLGAAGKVDQPFERCVVDIAGQYAYNLARLAERFRGTLGPQVQMQGTGQRAFSFRGPLLANTSQTTPVRAVSQSSSVSSSAFANLREMLAEAGVGWQQLSVYGFEVGAGEVDTKLADGILTISPINLPVSEGKIAIAPRVDVRQSPYIATLQPGTIVDRVRISPEMCRSWLKYLAPIAADATDAEGSFSVTVDAAQFPVSDPTGGNIQGQLHIHSGKIGPGPLSREIVGIAQLIKSVVEKRTFAADQVSYNQWLDLPEQKINLQLADHRVYHRDMWFSVQDVVVKTSGWVGLDQQMALVAEIPVRDEWVSQDRYLASLKGQVIRLPISGTVSRPQVDRTAIRELTRQTVINAGSNLLQNELNRGLNRLFQQNVPPAGTSPQPPPP